MQKLLTSLFAVALVATVVKGDTPAKADAKTTPEAGSFAAIQKELADEAKKHSDAQMAVFKTFQEAKTDEERKQARDKFMALQSSSPGPKFAPRFLAFAEKNPKAPEAFDA